MAADWTSIENALRAYVKSASGFDDAHVIWAHPNASRPSGTFITLELLADSGMGAFPDTVERVDLSRAGNGTTTVGTEVELQATQTLDCGLRVQCYAQPARAGRPAPPSGPASARAVLTAVRVASALSSNVAALDAVGVSIYEPGSVQYVPELVGSDFEGRAVLELRFYVAETVSEFTTFIDHVTITDQEDNVTFTT